MMSEPNESTVMRVPAENLIEGSMLADVVPVAWLVGGDPSLSVKVCSLLSRLLVQADERAARSAGPGVDPDTRIAVALFDVWITAAGWCHVTDQQIGRYAPQTLPRSRPPSRCATSIRPCWSVCGECARLPCRTSTRTALPG